MSNQKKSGRGCSSYLLSMEVANIIMQKEIISVSIFSTLFDDILEDSKPGLALNQMACFSYLLIEPEAGW